MYRKGGVLYYTICARVPETQKCVTFVTFVTFWHKCQHVTALFVTLALLTVLTNKPTRYCTVCNRSLRSLLWHKCQRVTALFVTLALLTVLTNKPTWDSCKYAIPLIFFNVYCIFFGFRAFYLFFIQIFAVILHSHSALESHSRYRSTKSAGDQGLCSPQKSEIFGGPKKDASHVHRTLIALPSHTLARGVHE